MRVDGKPGNGFFRWSGGKLQFVASEDQVVLMEFKPDDNEIEQPFLRVTEAVRLTGQIFMPDGELLTGAADLNNAGDYSKNQKVIVGDLKPAAAADDIVFDWTNTEGKDAIVTRVLVDITTAGGTGGATLDAGGAADTTTGSADLITGADVNTTAAYDSMDIAGVGVATFKRVPDGECVTGQVKTEIAAALEGKYYIFYAVAG